MTHGGFLEQKRRSPTSLLVVLALHGAAITALMLAKGELPGITYFPPIKMKEYKEPPPPPPIELDVKQPEQRTDTQPITRAEPIVDIRPFDSLVLPREDSVITPLPPRTDPIVQPPADSPQPKADPVRVEAQIDSHSALQPPYPASLQRSGTEGSVTVRVRIDARGRVIAVELVKASDDGFWRATERQALRHWRFTPATLDGRPIESSRLMTVRFKLDA